VAHERQTGFIYSATLHILFFLLAFFGLPSLFKSDPPIEPAAITVEILPITGITNIKPSEEPPAPEEKKVEKPAEQAKPSPPVKTAEAAPPPPPEEAAIPKPKEKPPEKKVEKPEDKKEDKKKTKDESLDAILKAVKATAQKEKKDKEKTDADSSKSKSFSSKFDPTLQLSMSEKDAIMSQIAKCWSVPAGVKDAQNLVVVVMAEFNSDGSYIRVELNDEGKSRYGRENNFRAAADSAIRAVKMCSPLRGLPAERFNGWREMELSFNPKFMLN